MALTAPGAAPPLEEKFEVLVSVPLVYVEALALAEGEGAGRSSRRLLRVVARGWDPMPNFEPVGVGAGEAMAAGGAALAALGGGEGRDSFSFSFSFSPASASSAGAGAGAGGAGAGAASRLIHNSARHSLLASRPHSTLWQLTLQFDGEQACMLARDHVEGRGAALRERLRERLAEGLRGHVGGLDGWP